MFFKNTHALIKLVVNQLTKLLLLLLLLLLLF